MNEVPVEDRAFALASDELRFLRFMSNVYAEEESPLFDIQKDQDARSLELATSRLLKRGLLEPRTLKPNRELVRRLLIVSQPDARIVVLRSQPDGGQRELDVYERSGAFVGVEQDGDVLRLGVPCEQKDLLAELLSRFVPRTSTGDFIDVELDGREYFAFSLLAGDLAARRRGPHHEPMRAASATDPALSPLEPDTHKVKRLQASDDGPAVDLSARFADEGTPIHSILRAMPEERSGARPSATDWDAAVESLVRKDLIQNSGEHFSLRPFLHDLAIGLATKRRVVITRFDFAERDWIVRDATLVVVPGSIFSVGPGEKEALRIRELDDVSLEQVVRTTIDAEAL